MTDLATLTADLERLKAARRSGVLSVQFTDRHVTYRSDFELVRAIAALESEIATTQGTARPRSINIRSDKGWMA